VEGLEVIYQQVALAPFSHANGAPLIFFANMSLLKIKETYKK